MYQRSRILLAATLAAGLVLTSGHPASAAFSDAVLGCRASVTKNGGKLVKTYLKTITGCHKSRAKDGALSGTDCNDLAAADFKDKLPSAETKFLDSIGGAKSKCLGVTPADALFVACPVPCTGTLTDFGDVADCLLCLTKAEVEDFSAANYGTPVSPLTSDDASCQNGIAKSSSGVVNTVLKDVSKCQSTAEKAGTETIDTCADTGFPSAAVDEAAVSSEAAIADSCDAATFTNLDSCASGQFLVAECATDASVASGQELVTNFLELESGVVTTTTTTTTTLPTAQDPQCPDVGELTLLSRDTNIYCDAMTPCTAPRTCNLTLNICQSATDLDSGWVGLGHNADINDDVTTRASLTCAGPNSPTGCGECTVDGIDPAPGNCRCANNNRTICDQPFVADADDCGGAVCNCFFGSPFPLAAGGTPACIVNRFAVDISGTANVDLGEGAITASLRTQVFLGNDIISPCPTCGGSCSGDPARPCQTDANCADPLPDAGTCINTEVAGDGARDGLCFTGVSDGLDCDAAGQNASFPVTPGGAPGGGAYSLDCMPDIGKNVSGSGLRLTLAQTTGSSNITSAVDCDGAGVGTALCPCAVCSKSPSVPCSSDSECASQGGNCSLFPTFGCSVDGDCSGINMGTCTAFGNTRCSLLTTRSCTTNAECNPVAGGTCVLSSCSAIGTGITPKPNDCAGGACTDVGGGEGECTTGPDTNYCDGMIKANGDGFVTCSIDDDCGPSSIGVDGGTCTLTQRRPCFLNPIVSTGTPDPEFPVAGATFCIPPTSNSSINTVTGLPGPGRARNQGEAHTYCASNHAIAYVPGGDVCP